MGSKLPAERIRIWVQKITESDKKAFDKLFRCWYPRLVRFAFKYVQDKAAASDIVQNVFIKVWQKRETLDPKRSVKAYLYRAVRNRSLNYLRDHSRVTVGLESLGASDLKSEEKRNERGEDEHLLALLKEWIQELPERQREAFELSRFDGLDHNEIAEVMEVSPNTVNNHIVAALKQLRSWYDDSQIEINEINYD